jgi:hypothetical protein
MRYLMTKRTKLIATLVTILVVIIGILSLAANERKLPNLAVKLAACDAFPNNSIQKVVETTRLTIKLPKYFYLKNLDSPLIFKNATGNAKAYWISNAGPMGNSYGVTKLCSAYYYEFEGTGEVDLKLKSLVKGIADYFVRFIVPPNVADQPINYLNDAYRFTFKLPNSWQGYSVLNQQWIGYATGGAKGDVNTEKGPQIIIRNPKWTTANRRQDIPIMVFTPSQWKALHQEKFYVSAAPIPPSELGRNTHYIFALPPRYNYVFPTGWQEVAKILEGRPFRAF